jgi:hypothetical protein
VGRSCCLAQMSLRRPIAGFQRRHPRKAENLETRCITWRYNLSEFLISRPWEKNKSQQTTAIKQQDKVILIVLNVVVFGHFLSSSAPW